MTDLAPGLSDELLRSLWEARATIEGITSAWPVTAEEVRARFTTYGARTSCRAHLADEAEAVDLDALAPMLRRLPLTPQSSHRRPGADLPAPARWLIDAARAEIVRADAQLARLAAEERELHEWRRARSARAARLRAFSIRLRPTDRDRAEQALARSREILALPCPFGAAAQRRLHHLRREAEGSKTYAEGAIASLTSGHASTWSRLARATAIGYATRASVDTIAPEALAAALGVRDGEDEHEPTDGELHAIEAEGDPWDDDDTGTVLGDVVDAQRRGVWEPLPVAHRGRIFREIAKQRGVELGKRGPKAAGSNSDTVSELAEDLGVNERTMRRGIAAANAYDALPEPVPLPAAPRQLTLFAVG